MKTQKLIFVYNADGGMFSAIADAAHKLIAPSTYPCSLCAITYGAVSMRQEWKDYLHRLPLDARFYHRDEFARDWPDMDAELPAVFAPTDSGTLTLLLSKDDLDSVTSVAQLTALLDRRIAHNGALADGSR